MPVHKVTQFLSEISTFFRKNNSDRAMFTIMEVIKGIRMNEWTLFGRKSRSGSKYSLLQVFQLLLVCPCFMIRNSFNIYGSPLGGKLGCRKDVFYEFLNDGRTDWRKLMYHIVRQLWTKVIVRSDHKSEDTCLMIDDTDFPKTGRRMENIGRVHSHLEHRSILGFKALFLGITDGISQMLLDFAILGEKGKKGNYGMSEKELSRRYTTERDEDIAIQRRIDEYSMSKIDLTIEMICRAIKHKIRFRYVLADSWFTCAKIVRFIRSRHIKCDYIGMIKVGEEGKTKYRFERKELTAPSIIKKLNKRGEKKYSRKLKCWYSVPMSSLQTPKSACFSSVAASEVHGADCSRLTSRWDSSRHTGFTPDAGLRRSSSRRVRDCSALASASLPTLLRRLQARPSWHSSTIYSLP